MTDPVDFLGDLDLHLFAEGRHRTLWRRLGAHAGTLNGHEGTRFAVWAPNARDVSVIGNFNAWRIGVNPLEMRGESGVWEGFVPGARVGQPYKFAVVGADGRTREKADPFARESESAPTNASVITQDAFEWSDDAWMNARRDGIAHEKPVSIYELHLGSFLRDPARPDAPLDLRALTPRIVEHVTRLGFTHVELLPIMEHPFGGSWGYQVTSYFAPESRWGTPADFKRLIDELHRAGVGVILDWVPAHFPKDDWALARFDGTALFEHADPRKGEHPDWGTYVFNLSRHEVRAFLLASALYWLDEFHVDGLRVDAVASMLYLDYSRRDGEWIPNEHGGRENLDSISFFRELNTIAHAEHPGVLMIAEESTSFPGVSKPVYANGLGFGFKWNMGWMHDVLEYFALDPIHRQHHHKLITFAMMYAYAEHFVLPLSHDEVVHLKGSLFGKMAGATEDEKLANLRALYALMWSHPGRKLLFMGGEIAQRGEWNHDRSLDWHLREDSRHAGVERLLADMNALYRDRTALHEGDSNPRGFTWIDVDSAHANVVAFRRIAPSSGAELVAVCNFSGQTHVGYRIGLPKGGVWREVLNTDARDYGGEGGGNFGKVESEPVPYQGLAHSIRLTLPRFSVIWLELV